MPKTRTKPFPIITPTVLDTPCRVYRGPRSGMQYGAPRFNNQQVFLHRWVIEQVEGVPLAPGEVVMHHCDNPPCFRYDHLRRATAKENSQDMMAKGRGGFGHFIGEAVGTSKLSEDHVRSIRQEYRRGVPSADPASTRSLARKFGVSETLIRQIVRGEAWKHLL